MRGLARFIALACFLLTLGLTLSLRHATGGALFTQLPQESLAKMQEAPAEDAFAGLGLNDLAGEPTKVDNSFRFGLLPGGPGSYLAESVSVLTISGPALLLFVLTLVFTRRSRRPTT